MKTKNLILLLAIVAAVFTGCSKDKEPTPTDETLSGGDVSGVWEKGKTYYIDGHINVPEGQSLTIEEGVTVVMTDTALRTEFIVNGNLYCMGTEQNPITITVPEEYRTTDHELGGLWGGILATSTCAELVMLYTTVEYTGAVTTEESPSVKQGLYKAEAGEGLPLLNSANVDGKIVIMHCTFRHAHEDMCYLEGGKILIANNLFYTSGDQGGEQVNLKSGVVADVCFNVMYSPNTNAMKLSNSGDRTPQCDVLGYNNTLINCGWRRPTVKGGGIWLEKDVYARIYNNLYVNDRYGIKLNKPDDRTIYDYTWYYGYTQTCVDQFQTTEADVVRGSHDVAGTMAGENDPQFVNYPLSTDYYNFIFNDSWDFHLKASSPALTGAFTDFTPHFANGLTVNGVTYKTPTPATYFGAFGTE